MGVEAKPWGFETAIEGAADRLTPILMTSLVTALGVLPLAIGMNEPGREIEGPMALVILGGLLTSMALNLLILPILALRYGRFELLDARDELGQPDARQNSPPTKVRFEVDLIRMNEFHHAPAAKSQLRELLFRISVALKGLHAVLEIVGGIALLVVSPALILRVIEFLTQDEIAEDPRDLVANYLLDAARHLSLGSQHFAAYYLLSHGVIKAFLVAALLKSKLWAYPLALTVFGAFIAYQLYRFTFTHSTGLIALSLFDLVVIWLIWLEYRALRPRAY